MAKRQGNDIETITKMLQEASTNKQNLSSVSSAVSKFIKAQRKALEDLETNLASITGTGEIREIPEFKDSEGKVLDKRSKEYKAAKAEWEANKDKEEGEKPKKHKAVGNVKARGFF